MSTKNSLEDNVLLTQCIPLLQMIWMTFQKGGGRGRKSTRNTKVVEEEVDEKDKPYACDRELILIGHVTLVAITGTTIMVPYL